MLEAQKVLRNYSSYMNTVNTLSSKDYQGAFPDAQALNDIRKVNEDIEQDKLNIVEFDLLVCSFPCYKNTQLRDENGGNYHPSGDLFTEDQMKFISLVRPKHVLNEMTP